MNMARKVGIAGLWVVSIFGGVLMIRLGFSKVVGTAPWPRFFQEFGYPAWFRVVVGLAQLAGGGALLVPRIAHYGAGLLTVVMAGAVVTELTREGGFPSPVTALVYMLIFASLFVIRLRGRQRRPAKAA
jgi:putative oxidoreductase